MANNDPFRHLVRKLRHACKLNSDEIEAVEALPHSLRTYGPGADILRDGDVPSNAASLWKVICTGSNSFAREAGRSCRSITRATCRIC